jgi:pimeloyl-ACP methyl ester carboxylesterase
MPVPRRLLLVLTASLVPSATRAQQPADSSFYLTVAPGESLHVVVAGRGPAVVLVPGLFGCAFGFRHLLAALPAQGYRAIVVEPLAMGGSGRPERADYSLTAQADRVASAIARLGAAPALVVAHSLGGSIALRLAVRHPDAVRAIVSLEGGPMESAGTKGFRRAMTYVPWLKWLGGMKRLRPRIRHDLVASSGDTAWVTDATVEAYTAGAAADLDGTLKAYLRMADAREPERLKPRLHELAMPVRLLLGAARHTSGPSPDQVRELVEQVPQLAIDTIAGAGHHLAEEAPGAVLTAIGRADPVARPTEAAALSPAGERRP